MRTVSFAMGAIVVLGWPHVMPIAAGTALERGPQTPRFRTSSDIVEVYATATGRNGAGVTDLRGDEFELFEDGKRRDITVFSAAVQPLSVAIVLDHSGSTDGEFAQVLQAAGAFVGRLFKEDRARIDTLAWDCVPFTGDRMTLVQALQNPLPRDPGSPVWSATDRAIAALGPEPGRRVILLLSDGSDNQSDMLNQRAPSGRSSDKAAHSCVRADTTKLIRLSEVIDRAERETVMVYAVAVPEGVSMGAPSSGGDTWASSVYAPPLLERNAISDLAALAKRSGGSVQRLTSYSQLDAAFKRIADELHLQYLLGFVPSQFDGKRHDIMVRVKRAGVSVRAREAYIAQRR